MSFHLKTPGRVRMTVYDLRGAVVRDLLDEPRDAGRIQLEWDGKNNGGDKMPTGVYLCRIETGSETKSLKMSLVK